MKNRVEYLSVRLPLIGHDADGERARKLTELASMGWRLVAVVPYGESAHVAYMMREIPA